MSQALRAAGSSRSGSSRVTAIVYGREVSITYDWNGPGDQAPVAGDALQSKTRFYLITEVRRVNSKVHPSRWRIKGVVAEDAAGAKRLLPLYWAKRGRAAT